MRFFTKSHIAVASMLVCASATAFAIEFAIEGKLSHIETVDTPSPTDPSVMIKKPVYVMCAGTKVDIGPNTIFTTPTGTITDQQFVSTVRFPGKPATDKSPAHKPALTDGTCIIEGDTANGVSVASEVFAEVAENVLVGASSNAPGTPFEILNVKVVMLDNDPAGRIVASKPINAFGAPILLSSVLPGDLSAAEGYLGDDGVFYAFAVETTGGDLSDPPSASSATVQRGDATYVSNTAIKLEVRGGCLFVGPRPDNLAARTLRLAVAVDRGMDPLDPTKTNWVNPNDTRPITTATTNVTCTEDLAAIGSGTFRYRQDRYTGFSPYLPTKVRVSVTPPTGTNPATPITGAEIPLNRTKFP